MPSKYLYDQEQIQGSNYITPFIQPAQKPASTLASDMAGVAKTVITNQQTAALRGELEKESDAFINPEAIDSNLGTDELYTEGDFDEISAAEKEFMDNTQRETNRLKRAHEQGRLTTSAFRAKVESVLKGKINQTPGLTAELRRVASDTLGFDPTGATLKDAMDASDALATSGKKQIDHMGSILDTAGVSESHLTREENVAKHWATYSAQHLRHEMATKNLTEYKAIHDLSALQEFKLAKGAAATDLEMTLTTVKGVLNIETISAASLNNMTKEEKDTAVFKLQNLLTLNKETRRRQWSQNTDKIDGVFAVSDEYITNTINYLNGTQTAEIYANNYKILNDSLRADLLNGDPRLAKMITFLQMAGPGLSSLDPSALTGMSHLMSGQINALLSSNPDDAVAQEMLKNNATAAEVKQAQGEAMRGVLGRIERNYGTENMTPEMEEIAYRNLVNYTRDIRAYPEEVATGHLDKIYELAAKMPSMRKFVQGPNGRKELYTNLIMAGPEYITRTFASLRADIEDDTLSDNSNFTVTIMDNGFVKFVPTPVKDSGEKAKQVDDLKTRFGGGELSPDRKEQQKKHLEARAAELNNRYAARLNNLTQSLATLDGSTVLNVAINTLGRGLFNLFPNQLDPVLKDKIEAASSSRKTEPSNETPLTPPSPLKDGVYEQADGSLVTIKNGEIFK